MSNVIVTHTDGTQDVYQNFMAGISNQQGTGWKLCLVPTDPTQPSWIIDLRSGDTYQTTASLPDPSAYVAAAQLAGITVDPTLIPADVEPVSVTDTVT